MLNSWFKGLFGRDRGRERRGRGNTPVRPGVEPLEDRFLLTATLLKDINTTVTDGASPREVTEFAGRAFFGAADGQREGLYASDGTAAGTTLVKEVPGGVARMADAGGTLFVAANGGSELWKSDGTSAGTVFVSNIRLARDDFFALQRLTPVGANVFFVGQDDELWVSDGTAAGTRLVKDINPAGASAPVGLTPLGNNLFFFADDGAHGLELWVSDGTADGTVLVKDIQPGPNSSSFTGEATALGDRLIFAADDGANGEELWVSDGTPDATTMLKDIKTGDGFAGSSFPRGFTPQGSDVYFAADDGLTGRELWVTDGTPDGTRLVKDINPGFFSSDLHGLEVLGDQVIFSADDGVHGFEPWASDGTEEGTLLLKDVRPGPDSSLRTSTLPFMSVSVFDGRAVGDMFFFTADDGAHGLELWVSDGTAGGTVLVRDVRPGSQGSHDVPSPFGAPFLMEGAAVGGRLVFVADDGPYGRELWASDGTEACTELVADLNTQTHSRPSSFVVLGDRTLFVANDQTHGNELWITDGTTGGTVLLKDINPGADSGFHFPGGFVVLGNRVMFAADDGVHGEELWVSDGTPSGTTLLKDISPYASYPSSFTRVGNQVFFSADDGNVGQELWVTDGTPAGTKLVKDINTSDFGYSYPGQMMTLGTSLLFTADDGINGRELWVSDGTPAGTRMVKDINPGPNGSSLSGLGKMSYGVVNGSVIFPADDGTHGFEPWVSDGTPAGTMLLADIRPGPGGSSEENRVDLDIAGVAGKVIFAADDGTPGREVWVTDGTPGAVSLLKDLDPGTGNGTSFVPLVGVGSKMFFTNRADELWVSDGTTAGTFLVRDMNSPIVLMTAKDNRVVFCVEGVNETQWWISDGTVSGTAQVATTSPELAISTITGLTPFQGRLLFGANDGRAGQELWMLELPRGIRAQLIKVKTGTKTTLRLRVRFADTGTILADRKAAFQSPPYRAIKAVAIDTNGDGVTDSVRLTGKLGKRTKTRIYRF